MVLTGLPFATLALVFGVAAALVTALYILKLRRRAVATPFAPLWQRILRDKEATSLFSKLKRILSLLVQLLLLALLVAALGDPRLAKCRAVQAPDRIQKVSVELPARDGIRAHGTFRAAAAAMELSGISLRGGGVAAQRRAEL